MKKILLAFLSAACFKQVTAQNVGIGTTTPATKLHIVGNSAAGVQHIRLEENENDFARLGFHNSVNAKFWDVAALSDNDDNNSAFNFFNSSTGNLLSIKGNGNVGIGNTAPESPLSFANSLGNKISFWNSGTGNYGIGLQGNLLQIHSDLSVSDIAFGYGSSASFTENMRIKGNGNVGIGNANPTYKLDVTGRLRLRNSTGTAGIYFDGVTNPTRSFIGTYSEDYIGIWGGGGASWNLVMNVNNGNVGIGTTTPTADLQVNGYTKLGSSSAPAIATKLVTGTINLVDGTMISQDHGIPVDQIISMTVQVEYAISGVKGFVSPGFTTFVGYEFQFKNFGTAVQIHPKAGNSFNLLNQTYKVYIVYKQP